VAKEAAPPFHLKSVDQISWAVKDVDKTVEAWSAVFGIGPWKFVENSGLDGKGQPWKTREAYTHIGKIEIELVQCVEGRIPQSSFLDTRGEGLHHIGFLVDDVDVTVEDLVSKGAKSLVPFPGYFAYMDAGRPG
jgi:methylmalonyl-CoA/ethylmalonyl-CoA epimerase